MSTVISPIRQRNAAAEILYASAVTFLTYASVYGFRKGFTVCTFDGIAFAGIGYKTWLVLAQVLGYASSKFYGIRFIAELRRIGRGRIILLLSGISWMALFCFAIVPAPWNIPFLFLNGFPLGMIWGVVFSYVEGRRTTDLIGATLSVSFIFSSGFVKTIASWIGLRFGISEYWIPFATGLAFMLPLLFFIYLLEKIPPPSPRDVSQRSAREPMSGSRRMEFLTVFLPGIIASMSIYVFSTLFRDIRDNFIADMWKENGYGRQPSLFTATETPTAVIILLLLGSMVLIRNNVRALVYAHWFILAGFLITGFSSWFFVLHRISALWWLTLVGLGLYMTYIPFNCIFFERLIAAFKYRGNVGFLIYVADAFGYLASVMVLVTKEIIHVRISWTGFYSQGVIVLSVLGVCGTLYSLVYFTGKYKSKSWSYG